MSVACQVSLSIVSARGPWQHDDPGFDHCPDRSVPFGHLSGMRRMQRPVSQEGSITAFTVLMLVAVFVLMGLVVDGGAVLSAQQAASDEAEQAARAGAGALSVNALRTGVVELNQEEAIAAAQKFTVAAGHPGIATVSSGVVTGGDPGIESIRRSWGVWGLSPCRCRRRPPRSMSKA